MLQHWIWLATRQGVKDGEKVSLLEHFSDPEQIYFAPESDFESFALGEKGRQSLLDKDLSGAEKILEDCRKHRIHVLALHDGGYPHRLKNIPDPPVVLYYKGTLPDLDGTPTIGVVGTRKATGYGLTTAQKLGYQISRCGGIVVSGMAKGIDGQAMLGALAANGCVVGVLGCGADIVYPPQNRGLFLDTERYGCIFTEFPPGTPPYPGNFPQRNRIISGLSDGVLVVEAPLKSGALITARRAADQGRDVFVIPANLGVSTSEGSNALLRDGGILVGCGWDILSEYTGRYPGKIREFHDGILHREAFPTQTQVAQKPEKPAKKSAKDESAEKKVIDNGEKAPYIDLTKKLPALSDAEKAIVQQLSDGRKLVDDVIADSGLAAPAVLASLTLLEVKGIVCRLPGRYFELAREK